MRSRGERESQNPGACPRDEGEDARGQARGKERRGSTASPKRYSKCEEQDRAGTVTGWIVRRRAALRTALESTTQASRIATATRRPDPHGVRSRDKERNQCTRENPPQTRPPVGRARTSATT